MPPFGKIPASRSCGFRKNTVTFVPSFRLPLVEPLPRSQSARCSSSNTMVLPRGVTCAKPFGKTVPIRQGVAGNAVLMCSWRTFGIFAKASSSGEPRGTSDFPKLPRHLRPRVARVLADEQLAEEAEGDDPVAVRGMRREAPDRGVRSRRELQRVPRVTEVSRAQPVSRFSGRRLAAAREHE